MAEIGLSRLGQVHFPPDGIARSGLVEYRCAVATRMPPRRRLNGGSA